MDNNNGGVDPAKITIDWSKLQKPVIAKAMGIPEEIISDLYFETKDHNIISGTKLREIMHIIWGDDAPMSNNAVRKFAEDCEWITYEVNNPSITSLIKYGHTVTAIKLYYDFHRGISLVDAKNHIYKLKESMEN